MLILNTLRLSGLVYLGSIQTIPTPSMQSINQLIFNFLWSGKTQPINQATLFLPKNRGGPGITDLELKLSALQLKRLQSITSPLFEEKWIHLVRYWIGRKLSNVHPSWSFLGANNKPHFNLLNPPPPPPPLAPKFYQLLTGFSLSRNSNIEDLRKEKFSA